jgi:succinate-semialdehyde dehydrogenase/glutarate-semialdehyde dehydrogenase
MLKRSDLLREQAFVGGRWTSAETYMTIVNPADGRTIGRVPSLTISAVDEAIAAARDMLPVGATTSGARPNPEPLGGPHALAP